MCHGAKPEKFSPSSPGAHWHEYTSIIAIEKLINALDPRKSPASSSSSHWSTSLPSEQKVPHVKSHRQQKHEPLLPRQSRPARQTERASFLITNQIVDRCDYLIDYHAARPRPRAFVLTPTGANGKGRARSHLQAMVLAFGLDHIIIWRERPTTRRHCYLDNTASVRGKASIVRRKLVTPGTVESDDRSPSSSTAPSAPCAPSKCFPATLYPHRESGLAR